LRKKTDLKLITTIGIVWILIVITGYYLTHNPFNSFNPVLLLKAGWSLISVIIFIIIAGGIGKKIIPLESLPELSATGMQVALGLGVISVITLLTGTLWRINSIIVLATLIFFAVAFYRTEYSWFQSFKIGVLKIRKNRTKFQTVLMAILGFILIIQLIQSFAPPLHYDALNYHLTLPKTYLINEKISDLDWLVMSGMPQTTEMLYLNLIAIAGESAPLLLSCFFGIFTALGLIGYLNEKLDNDSAWVGAASLFGGITLVSSLAWGYVDWLSCYFGFGAIICLDQFRSTGNRKYVLISGIFAGLAYSTKYPAGVLFIAGLAVLIWHSWRMKIKLIPNFIQFSLGMGVFAMPWILKNIIFTGNPLYPFFFQSGSMDLTRISVYQGLPHFGNWLDFFFLPLRATFYGVEGTSGYSVSIGPLFLGLSLLALLNWEDKKNEIKSGIENVLIISIAGIMVWAIGNRVSGYLIQTRFYYVLFPAFAILSGYGFHFISQVKGKKINIRHLSILFIIPVLLFTLFETGMDFVKKGTLPVVTGIQDRQTYLENNLGWYALAMKQVKDLPMGSRVLMLYEPRGYECVPLCDPDEILDQWKVSLTRFENNSEILNSWQEAGYTHLLVYVKGMDFLRDEPDPHHPVYELDSLDEFLDNLSDPIDFGGWYSLFDLMQKSN
jgi:hypothetical protein